MMQKKPKRAISEYQKVTPLPLRSTKRKKITPHLGDRKGTQSLKHLAITNSLPSSEKEEALRQSEERYRTILENIEEAYFEDDLAGNFTFVNDVLCEQLGYTRQELIGMNFGQHVNKEDAKKLRELYNHVYATGETVKAFDLEAIKKDGTKAIYETSVSLMKDSEGKPVGFQGISRDITERKRMEEQLRQSEERFRRLVETMGVGLSAIDPNGVITYVNDQMCRMLGYSKEEFIGRPTTDFNDEVSRKRQEEILAKRRKGVKDPTPYEITWVTKDGRKVDTILTPTPAFSAGGEFTSSFAMFTDITERKRAEEALRESEKRYRQVIQNAVDIIYTTDANGNFTYANPAALTTTGYSLEELQRFNYLDLILPEHRDRVSKILISQFREKQATTYVEFPFFNKSGDVIWFGQNASLVIEREKRVGFHVIARDITERKRAEEALSENEKRLQSLMDASPIGISWADMEGNIKYNNRKFRQLFGYTVDDIPTIAEWRRLAYPDAAYRETVPSLVAILTEAQKQGKEMKPIEVTITCKDGSTRCVEQMGAFASNQILAIFNDLTEHKLAEEALKESEETAKQLAQENEIMAEIGRIVSSTLNIEEVYEQFSEEVRKLIPVDRIVINTIDVENATVKNVYMAGKGIKDRIVGKIYPLEGSGNAEMVRTKSSLLIQTKDFSEYKERFPMLLSTFEAGFQSIMNVPLFSKGRIIGGLLLRSVKPFAYTESDVRLAEKVSNQIAGAIANAQLFVERKQAEEALRRSEEKYRTILDEMEEGYFETDLAGKLTLINDAGCRNLGYPREELIGVDNRMYADEENRKKAFQTFTRVYRTGQPCKILDYELTRKDGAKVINELSVSLMRNKEGTPIGFRGISHHVTERIRVEKEVTRLSQENAAIAEIGRIISSTLETEEVYEQFAKEVRKLIVFDSIAINMINYEEGTVTVPFVSEISVPGCQPGEILPLAGSVTGKVVQTRSGLVIQTENRDEVKDQFPTLLTAFGKGLRSLMVVPLIFKDHVIGALHFRSVKSNAYSGKDLELAASIGNQIAGAIANAQLFIERKRAEEALRRSEEEAKRLSQENEIMAEIGRIISSTLNIDEVYGRFAAEVRKLIPLDRISLTTINPDHRSGTMAYVLGVEVEDRNQGAVFPFAGSFYEEIFSKRSGILVQTEDESELVDRYPILLSTLRAGLRSMITVPLISKDEVIGVLHIRSLKPTAYTESDLRLAERVGNQIAGAIANAQLFIERKQAEEALRQSEERYRTILENMQEVYYEIDLAGNWIFLNEAFYQHLGYTKEEMIGKKSRQYQDETTARELYQAYSRLYETGEPIRAVEAVWISKDGAKRTYEMSASLITDPEGKPIGFRGISRDVTERKRAEEALRQSEERYRTIIESIEDGYYEEDLAGNFVFFNEAMCRIYGYPKEELLGLNYKQYTDGETAKKLFQVFNEMYRTGNPCTEYSYELIRKDGVKRYIEASASLKRDLSGKPIGFRGVVRDVTERKKSDEKFTNLATHAPIGLSTLNNAGTYEYVNPKFTEIFGYTLEDIPTGKIWFEKAHPDPKYRRMVIDTWKKDLEPAKAGNPLARVFTVTCKDGSVKEILFKHVALTDESHLVAYEDITDLKQAEEALRSSEERYRTIIENIQDGYFEVDLAGNFTFVNDAECVILGYSRDELIGMNNRQYTGKENAKKLFQAFNKLYRTGEPIKGLDLEIVRKDGTKAFDELSVSLIRDSEGKPVGFRGISRDVTERKQAEEEKMFLQEQLRQSQKMEAIGQLAGGVAHDFNNLLTVIKGYSQLSILDLKESDPLRGNIQEIEKATQRATDLTRQLLAFSRRQILDLKVVDLNVLIKDLDKMLRRIIGEDIEFVTRLSEDLGKVKIDPSQIEQVIFNLAVNARDAMLSGGKLTIETANVELDEVYAHAHVGVVPGPFVRLSVSDTGVGMTQEVKEKVFEPFFTTKEKGKGTGLGLSMVYGIVKQSNGNIWVYSEPNRGTTFRIYFPRTEEEADTLREREETDFFPRGSETVLLVEDDELVRDLANRLLKQQGYTVLEAANGQEALRVAKERVGETIHLVLADIVMPQMGGKELADWIKISRPNIKVLFTSGYADNAIVHHGVLDPGTHFLQKPFSLKTLSRKVREVLDE